MTPSLQKLLYGWLMVTFITIIFLASYRITLLPWYSIFLVFFFSIFFADFLFKPRSWKEVVINSAILGFFEGIVLTSFGSMLKADLDIGFLIYTTLLLLFATVTTFSVFNGIGGFITYFIRKRKMKSYELEQQDIQDIYSFGNFLHKIRGIIPSSIFSILIIIGILNPWIEYEYSGVLMSFPHLFGVEQGNLIFVFALTAILMNWLIFHRNGRWTHLGHAGIGALIIIFAFFAYYHILLNYSHPYLQFHGLCWGAYLTFTGGVGLLLSGSFMFILQNKKVRNKSKREEMV